MKRASKYKVDFLLLFLIFCMVLISIITIYSSRTVLPSHLNNLYIKQIVWYILGFVLIYFIMRIGNKWIYENIWYFYWFFVILLALLLIFATPINGTKAWFIIPNIGLFQPSEFMKIILIITLGKVINDFNSNFRSPTVKEEFRFIIKIGLIAALPAALTFMQPDTGVVLIYAIIVTFMLFISGIRYRWFAILFGGIALIIATVLFTYYANTDLFIDIFGTDFFLRVDRLLDWSSKTGFQLENGMSAIGSGGLFGHGINNTPVYFPEAQTDFIFAVFASNFGLIGSGILFFVLLTFDIRIIVIALKNKSMTDKYIAAGIVGMLIYQQVQNIGMTYGILPITGITLPFISYGGSSLISYMIMAGIIFNISNYTIRFKN